MAKIKWPLLLLTGLLLLPHHASAFAQSSFDIWLHDLELEAVASGIPAETVRSTLENAVLDERVVELDQKQPETTATFDSYNRRMLSGDRIERGADMVEKYRVILNEVSSRYGVQPQIIVALWSVESNYGRHSGNYNIIDSLLTLAYEGRRSAFFRKELIDALHIVASERIDPSEMVGSWAGAMGQCQFMPSTYLKYAVDYDNTGQRDIWQNQRDVFASIANYIAAEGWTANETWGREVELENAISADNVGLDHRHSLAEWQALGVRSLGGDPLPNKELQASLIQPDGPDGRSFLVYDNFRALMRWNRSTYFAITVGQLADRINASQ